jgi:hypothetical protein
VIVVVVGGGGGSGGGVYAFVEVKCEGICCDVHDSMFDPSHNKLELNPTHLYRNVCLCVSLCVCVCACSYQRRHSDAKLVQHSTPFHSTTHQNTTKRNTLMSCPENKELHKLRRHLKHLMVSGFLSRTEFEKATKIVLSQKNFCYFSC